MKKLTSLLCYLTALVSIVILSYAVDSQWQMTVPSAIPIEKCETVILDIRFMSDGNPSFGGSVSKNKASFYFINTTWCPVGQRHPATLNIIGSFGGTVTATFALRSVTTLSKTVNVYIVHLSATSILTVTGDILAVYHCRKQKKKQKTMLVADCNQCCPFQGRQCSRMAEPFCYHQLWR